MKCYHTCISYKDHVTNEEVCAKIQQAIGPHKDLTIIKRRKLKWYGHVFCSSRKTTLGNGQFLKLQSPRRQWRTGKKGGNWMQNHLWCPSDPCSYGKDEMRWDGGQLSFRKHSIVKLWIGGTSKWRAKKEEKKKDVAQLVAQPAHRWGGFDSPVQQGIFLPLTTFNADSLMRVRTPPCAIAGINICAHVKDPKHWQPYF